MDMLLLRDRVDWRECMTCEQLSARPDGGTYYCTRNDADVDPDIVEDYAAPIWCPDLSGEECLCAALL